MVSILARSFPEGASSRMVEQRYLPYNATRLIQEEPNRCKISDISFVGKFVGKLGWLNVSEPGKGRLLASSRPLRPSQNAPSLLRTEAVR
jgi:hypothetical protein